MSNKKQPTIKDVSNLAGVGVSTVSRYINKSGYVSEKVAEKINDAIKELNFIPSNYARILKGSSSKILTLIVPDITNPYYGEMYATVQTLAEKYDYYVYLYQSNKKEQNELKAITICKNTFSEGLIFCSEGKSVQVLEALKELDIPIVASNLYDEVCFDTIHSEDGIGIFLMTRYLLEQGHQKIGYAGGSKESYINQKRKRGYQKALLEKNITMNDDYVFEMDFSADAGYRAGKYFATLKDKPTAICAANDMIALGVITGLQEQDIRIPEDISVTGEDDIEFAKMWRPSLTTVDNSGSKFGEIACKMLFERIIEGYNGTPRVVKSERKVIVRQSTKSIKSE